MDYKLNVFFLNGKELNISLKEDEFKGFLEELTSNQPHWNEGNVSGFGVPLYNVLYYSFIEYTDDLKQADKEKAAKAHEEAVAKAEAEKKPVEEEKK